MHTRPSNVRTKDTKYNTHAHTHTHIFRAWNKCRLEICYGMSGWIRGTRGHSGNVLRARLMPRLQVGAPGCTFRTACHRTSAKVNNQGLVKQGCLFLVIYSDNLDLVKQRFINQMGTLPSLFARDFLNSCLLNGLMGALQNDSSSHFKWYPQMWQHKSL